MPNAYTTDSRVFAVEGAKRAGDAIFNPNAFPERTHQHVESCKRRLALFLGHIESLPGGILEARVSLTKRLRDPEAGDWAGWLERWQQIGTVAVYDGMAYYTHLHGALYALKSLLDTYAQLTGCLILHTSPRLTFKRRHVGSDELAGGALIKWLRGSTPSSYSIRMTLADVLERHSRKWITPAVQFRDDLAHDRDFPGMKETHVYLRPAPPHFLEQDIVDPSFADGTSLTSFAANLRENLLQFLVDSLALLPEIDQTRISLSPQSFGSYEGLVLRLEFPDPHGVSPAPDNSRTQTQRIALMQNNREDCGSPFHEIILPIPKSKAWADPQPVAP
jgi:hypothetical protein